MLDQDLVPYSDEMGAGSIATRDGRKFITDRPMVVLHLDGATC